MLVHYRVTPCIKFAGYPFHPKKLFTIIIIVIVIIIIIIIIVVVIVIVIVIVIYLGGDRGSRATVSLLPELEPRPLGMELSAIAMRPLRPKIDVYFIHDI